MAKKEVKRIFQYEKMTQTALKKLNPANTMVIATFSPLEVHGPHLPFGQDYFEGYAMAEATAEKMAKKNPAWSFLLLPPMPVATDTLPQIGSIEFPAPMVRDVAYHLLANFAKHGFARLAISSFHGGPRHFLSLETAADMITQEFGTPAMSLFSAVLSQITEGDVFYDAIKDNPECKMTKEMLKKDHHAGFVETCMALNLWPELIEPDWDSLPPSTPDRTQEGEMNDSYLYGYDGKPTIRQKVERTWGVVDAIARTLKHFRQNTYYGYPALATKSQGVDLLGHLTDLATEISQEFLDKGSDMELHSPLWRFHKIMLNRTLNKAANQFLGI